MQKLLGKIKHIGVRKLYDRPPQKSTKMTKDMREMTGSGKFRMELLPTAYTNAVKKLQQGRIRIPGEMEHILKS